MDKFSKSDCKHLLPLDKGQKTIYHPQRIERVIYCYNIAFCHFNFAMVFHNFLADRNHQSPYKPH